MKLSEAVFFEKLAAEKRIELDRAADLSGIKWSAAAESKNGGIDRAPLCVCVCVCVCVIRKCIQLDALITTSSHSIPHNIDHPPKETWAHRHNDPLNILLQDLHLIVSNSCD